MSGTTMRAVAAALSSTRDATARRWRTGVVVSTNAAAGTVTVLPATGVDSSDYITVRYLCDAPPKPGATVWMVTDGTDVIAVGALAPVPPMCRLWRSTDLSIANGAVTQVTFDNPATSGNAHDPWGMWSSGQPTRITIPQSGIYRAGCHGTFAAVNTTGLRDIGIKVNGTLIRAQDRVGSPLAGTPIQQSTAWEGYLAAGDYVEMRVYQTSGGALNMTTTDWSPQFAVSWVGHSA